jgi:MFS family permease
MIMLKTLFQIYSLLLAVAVLLLGSGLLGTTVVLRAESEAFSPGLTGVIMSGFFLGYLIGSYLCPRIVRGVGHIRAFAAFAAAGCVAVLLHGLLVHPMVWLVLRLITGVSMLGLYLVIESWLNATAQHSHRGRLFAVYMSVNLLALAAGQYMILIYGATGVAPFALVAIFFALALVPVALTRLEAPALVAMPELGLRRLYGISPLGAMGALINGLAIGAFWGLGPLFGRDIGLGDAGVALFMSALVLGGALLQWPIGHLSDRHDRRTVLLGVSAAAGLAAALVFALVDISTAGVIVAAVLCGGFGFSVYSLSVAHTNDHLEQGQILGATRGLLMLSGIGSTVGPVLAGLLIGLSTARVLMAYMAVMFACLAAFAWLRMRAPVAVPVDEQAEFVLMARTSPAVLELDPRVDAISTAEPERGMREGGPASYDSPADNGQVHREAQGRPGQGETRTTVDDG